MLILRDYLIQNWALILISLSFLVSLHTTAFLDKKFAKRMFLLIFETLILSVFVFIEFELEDLGIVWEGRPYLMFIRYSAGALLEAQVLYSLVKKYPRIIFIPAVITTVICFINIYTGIINRVLEDGTIQYGPLKLFPYIVPGAYGCFIVYFLYKRTNKQINDLFPVAFFSLALGSMVILPFLFGHAYSQIFCKTIGIALFTYYLFSIQNVTKTDPLTGVLNRQACYAELETEPEGISALVSIDMNGLKNLNDTRGHAAGDEALTAIAQCLTQASKAHQSVYRIGGDEFLVICRQTAPGEVLRLVDRIRKNVSGTEYSISVGYSCTGNSRKSVSEMMKESDEMMYAEKAQHYQEIGVDRRRN